MIAAGLKLHCNIEHKGTSAMQKTQIVTQGTWRYICLALNAFNSFRLTTAFIALFLKLPYWWNEELLDIERDFSFPLTQMFINTGSQLVGQDQTEGISVI